MRGRRCGEGEEGEREAGGVVRGEKVEKESGGVVRGRRGKEKQEVC